MATLTASGVTTSNGQLDGFYTGSTSTNTSYPIGSYVLMQGNVSDAYVNATSSVYSPASGNPYYFWQSSVGSGSGACSGTWRSRGQIDNQVLTYRVFLMQRVA